MREEPSNSDVSGLVRSKEFENVIHCHLQHFAVSDAIVLAELYHETVKTVDSLYLFAHCLVRGTRIEAAYNLLKFDGVCSTPEIRYLFAHCCCLLDKYGFLFFFTISGFFYRIFTIFLQQKF
ncbi:unnamed protein product [Gongylonema pulchrum]|uniref:Pentatricopeptide repeat-containing protein n=1 Tax=Gongylonema pulchrum TaxID=637853 RepID=A0A183ESR7_9BILA|nr:unnamed protein product [Gongylonema pulchrum]